MNPDQNQKDSGGGGGSSSSGDKFGAIPRKKLTPLPPEQQQPQAAAAAAAAVVPPRPRQPSSSSSPPPRLHKKVKSSHGGGHHSLPLHRSSSVSSQHSASSGGGGAFPRRPSSPSSQRSLPIGKKKPERVVRVSEFPLVMRIRTKGVPRVEGLPQARSSARMPKRKRPTYQEADETDSDDFMDSDDEAAAAIRNKKKSASKKRRASDAGNASDKSAAASETAGGALSSSSMGAAAGEAPAIDGPPPGMPSTLWYSREAFLDVWVMEKVCGWKTRTSFGLLDTVSGKEVQLDPQRARKFQTKALVDEDFWSNPKKRMEVSRIVPQKCPVILAMAAEEQESLLPRTVAAPADPGTPTKDTAAAPPGPGGALADDAAAAAILSLGTPKKKPDDLDAAAAAILSLDTPTASAEPDSSNPRFKLMAIHREEVLLVKWRGRSHLHCSWERASDIQRHDLNNTARHKIRRFYQNQEATIGLDWKKVIEEERTTAAAIHSHGEVPSIGAIDPDIDPDADQDDEYFSPQCLEVERIIGCDENEMNMQVLAKQRALNMKVEQEAIRLRDEEASLLSGGGEKMAAATIIDKGDKAVKGIRKVVEGLINKADDAWDPEDNVRYVVKWKGLPFAEMTWEYWRDIKRDAVDEAEDFWYRQRPPDVDEAIATSHKPHPHMKEFRKLQESPVFGVSSYERPVAALPDDGPKMPLLNSADEDVVETGLKLRSYQLEGVNWLLFNWWNRRSPILGDEMGR